MLTAWQVLWSFGEVSWFVCSERSWEEAQSNLEEWAVWQSSDCLSLSCVPNSAVAPEDLYLWYHTVWFTREGWEYWLNTLSEVCFSGRTQFFSLQQHSHSLSKCRPEFSVGNASGSARVHQGGQERTVRAKKSFLSPGPGSTDATDCICFKLDKACWERPRLSKVLTLGILLPIS